MKRMGYSRGTPDIFIEEPRNGYHGLRIEMKTRKTAWSEKGSISTEQKGWIDKLNQRGYFAVFCFGRDEAIKVIDEYLMEHK